DRRLLKTNLEFLFSCQMDSPEPQGDDAILLNTDSGLVWRLIRCKMRSWDGNLRARLTPACTARKTDLACSFPVRRASREPGLIAINETAQRWLQILKKLSRSSKH